MYCPRCGQQNDPGNRFCTSCGADLPEQEGHADKRSATDQDASPSRDANAEPAASKPASARRGFFARVIGTSRRERWISAATALAVVIAIGAFILLDTPKDDSSSDPFLRASDERCLAAKDQIEQVTTVTIGSEGGAALKPYADGLLEIVVRWRAAQRDLEPAPDQQAAADEYLASLLDLSNALATLSEAAGGEDAERTTKAAAEADAAAAVVEGQIDGLGLEQCGALVFQGSSG